MKKTIRTKPVQPPNTQIGIKQKFIIAAILIVAFVIGASSSYIFQSGNAPNTISVVQPKVNALVSLTTSTAQVTQEQSFAVTLTLDSVDNGVDAADFVVSFDEAFLEADSVQEGDFFRTYPSKNIASGTVKLSGVAFFENNKLVIPKGKGNVAKITFTPLKTGSTTIAVDPQNTIIASGGKNILDTQKIKDLEITIQ